MGKKSLDPTEYIGQRFGMLTVTDFDHDDYDHRGHLIHLMNCHCDCGSDKVFELSALKCGKITSCGCTKKFNIDKYLGKRYGLLTVTGFDHDEPGGNRVKHFLKCHCDCGNDTIANLKLLEAGDKLSCGCLKNFDPSKFIGERYGSLVVTDVDHVDRDAKPFRYYMKCHCDCGKDTVALLHHLRSGHTTSCGHKRVRDPQTYVGMKFGRATIIGHDRDEYNGKWVRRFMKCKCDCGNEFVTDLQLLISGITQSCGCYHTDVITKHGLYKHRLYRILDGMKKRCYNPNKDNYALYGGRGIEICDEWMDPENGVKNFYDWAIANGYDDDLTIDRIDNDGNYEPDNCRWVDNATQMRNFSKNVYLSFIDRHNGKVVGTMTFCLADWAIICGVSTTTIHYHLNNRNGRTTNQILLECIKKGRNYGKMVIPPELEKFNDPSKFGKSIHDNY